jgi:glycosyltransferase involved in cell wall biosynthesis
MKQLKIMQIGPTLYKGGVAVVIEELTKGLHQAGQQVVLIGNGGPCTQRLADMGVTIESVNWPRHPLDALKCSFKFRKFFKQYKPDIVHVHGRGPAMACVMAGREADFFTMHNPVLTKRKSLLDKGLIQRLFSPFGKKIIVLNDQTIDYLTSRFNINPQRMIKVGNGVDCDRFTLPDDAQRREARQQMGASENDIVGLFVGRLHYQKQPQILVDLAYQLRQANLSHIKIHMVGEGPDFDALTQRITELNLKEQCIFHGWMDPLQAYRAADLFLLPSAYEGYGIVAAEALACGCPVLMTPTGGYKEMIREAQTGFVSPSFESTDFINLAMQSLQNQDLLTRMRTPSRQWAQDHLSIKNQIQDTLHAYQAHLGL